MGERLRYYDPEKVGSFSGIQSFKKVSKHPEAWLRSQETYTLHAPVRRKFPRQKTIVPGPNFQMQADLIDFSALKNYNDGFKYILVVIDVFSKVAAVAFLKNKTSSEMIAAFQSLLPKLGSFSKLQTDAGKEFLNKPFQLWLKKQNISHFYTLNFEIKAAIVKRVIRTLKDKLWRYFSHTNTRRYVETLPLIVSAYNNTYHSSIKRSPNSVTQQNVEQVWQTLYADQPEKVAKFELDDFVRLSMTKMKFRKGYLPSWTDELFQIAKVIHGSPVLYKIKDLQGELLQGRFYEQELQKINKTDNLFRIEAILKRQRKGKHTEYFIKWQGYPDTFNSWVREEDLTNV